MFPQFTGIHHDALDLEDYSNMPIEITDTMEQIFLDFVKNINKRMELMERSLTFFIEHKSTVSHMTKQLNIFLSPKEFVERYNKIKNLPSHMTVKPSVVKEKVKVISNKEKINLKLRDAYKQQQVGLLEKETEIKKLKEHICPVPTPTVVTKENIRFVTVYPDIKVDVPLTFSVQSPKTVNIVGSLNNYVKRTDFINNVKVKHFTNEVRAKRTSGAREYYSDSGLLAKLRYMNQTLRLGCYTIAKTLNDDGFKAFKGGLITRSVVRNIFRWFS